MEIKEVRVSGSYWDPLVDVLPAEVRGAMDQAVSRRTHDGQDHGAEPDLMAGIRKLIELSVLRVIHDAEIRQWADAQRAELSRHRAELLKVTLSSRSAVQADLAKLRDVQQQVLQTHGRKTVPRDDLYKILWPTE